MPRRWPRPSRSPVRHHSVGGRPGGRRDRAGPAERAASSRRAEATACCSSMRPRQPSRARAPTSPSSRTARPGSRARRRAPARQTEIVRRSLTASQRRVAVLLRDLYVHGEPDPIAVILGATSLDEAMAGIEGLSRATALNERLGVEAGQRARQLDLLRADLAARRATLRRCPRRRARRRRALHRRRLGAATDGVHPSPAAGPDRAAADRPRVARPRSRATFGRPHRRGRRRASGRLRSDPSPPRRRPRRLRHRRPLVGRGRSSSMRLPTTSRGAPRAACPSVWASSRSTRP